MLKWQLTYPKQKRSTFLFVPLLFCPWPIPCGIIIIIGASRLFIIIITGGWWWYWLLLFIIIIIILSGDGIQQPAPPYVTHLLHAAKVTLAARVGCAVDSVAAEVACRHVVHFWCSTLITNIIISLTFFFLFLFTCIPWSAYTCTSSMYVFIDFGMRFRILLANQNETTLSHFLGLINYNWNLDVSFKNIYILIPIE